MNNFWKGFRTFVAVISAILFSLIMQTALILYNIDSRLLTPSTYRSALVIQQVYLRLPRVLADQLVLSIEYDPCSQNPFLCESLTPEFKNCVVQLIGQERLDALSPGDKIPTLLERDLIQPCIDQYLVRPSNDDPSGPPEFMINLKPSDWESILVLILPEEDLRLWTEDLINHFFEYLNGDRDTVILTFVDLKQRIAGPAGVDAMLDLIRLQPACKETQVEPMIASIIEGTVPDPFCYPPEDRLKSLKPELKEMLTATVKQIPDERILLDQESGENSAEGGGLGGSLQGIHLLFRMSPVLALSFMLLVTFLVVRTPRTWLRWWGIPSFFTGLGAAIIAMQNTILFDQLWLNLLASRVPAYLSLGLVEMLRGVISTLIRNVSAGILIGAAIIGLLGLGMWIFSFFIKGDSPRTSVG